MPVLDKGMTRGSFLRLFAAAPLAGAAITRAAFAQSVTPNVTLNFLNFHFSGDSYRVNTPQQAAAGDRGPYPDRLVMGGVGQISGEFKVGQTVFEGKVDAQGSFAHFENNLSPRPAGNNIPLKFTGTWFATNLVSFYLLGLFGTDAEGNFPLAAGVLVLDIFLVRPATPTIPLTQVPSRLTLVSNLSPSGVTPSKLPNGVTLLAPNDPLMGFYFIPIPVASNVPGHPEKKQGDERWGDERADHDREAHTPVLFSTLDESRTEPM
jgi:hypothetical protein